LLGESEETFVRFVEVTNQAREPWSTEMAAFVALPPARQQRTVAAAVVETPRMRLEKQASVCFEAGRELEDNEDVVDIPAQVAAGPHSPRATSTPLAQRNPFPPLPERAQAARQHNPFPPFSSQPAPAKAPVLSKARPAESAVAGKKVPGRFPSKPIPTRLPQPPDSPSWRVLACGERLPAIPSVLIREQLWAEMCPGLESEAGMGPFEMDLPVGSRLEDWGGGTAQENLLDVLRYVRNISLVVLEANDGGMRGDSQKVVMGPRYAPPTAPAKASLLVVYGALRVWIMKRRTGVSREALLPFLQRREIRYLWHATANFDGNDEPELGS
jgi:hypothetical protein